LNRLAAAHARLADLMSLGEQISLARGQTSAASVFRTKALRGGRMTKQYIQDAQRSYARALAAADESERELRDITDTAAVEKPQKELPLSSTPDTALYLATGAKTNFTWTANDPEDYLISPLDLFTWQRWIAYRFEKEIKLSTTTDYDSLLTMLLQGPVPGSLMDTLFFSYNHSALASAAALQNLSEIYLGVTPEWYRGTVKIVPRPPAGWGRTSARIPLGTGFLTLEYDFLRDRATVGIEHIEKELDFIFYFPLPASESSAGAQFKLGPDRYKVELTLRRESGNRTRVNIEDAD
jgi:hypothetical protein